VNLPFVDSSSHTKTTTPQSQINTTKENGGNMSDAGVLKGNPETTGTSVAGGTETHRPAAHGPSAGYGDNVEKDDRSASQALKDSGKGVTGILAGIHGVGEKIRGKVNAGVDDTFHEVCYPFLFCSSRC
jgi:hypothetical protein